MPTQQKSPGYPCRRLRPLACAAIAILTFTACTARTRYPQPNPGWHSRDYSIIFGRLQRIPTPPTPGASPDAPAPPPAWTVTFGDAGEQYNGEVALTPAERLIGYSGGEMVEIRGRFLNESTTDPYNGRWYVVDSIRKWNPHR